MQDGDWAKAGGGRGVLVWFAWLRTGRALWERIMADGRMGM
jgi:hypothetical protein